jgi:DNA-binding phage protein
MAADPDSIFHQANLSRILHQALWLAELAGEERDAVRRDALIAQCMATQLRAEGLGPSAIAAKLGIGRASVYRALEGSP